MKADKEGFIRLGAKLFAFSRPVVGGIGAEDVD